MVIKYKYEAICKSCKHSEYYYPTGDKNVKQLRCVLSGSDTNETTKACDKYIICLNK